MLPADAAGPAPLVIEVPSTPRAVTRPLTGRDGSVIGWVTSHDGNSVLITFGGGDAVDAGYVTVHTGRVTQLVRGAAVDPVLQRVAPSSLVVEGRQNPGRFVHVARPEIVLPPTR